MASRIDRESPEGFREHEIEFFPDADGWKDTTIIQFIRRREEMRLPTQEFTKCFICGRHLKFFREPIIVYVSGIGIRFSCPRCYYTESHGGNSDYERTEL